MRPIVKNRKDSLRSWLLRLPWADLSKSWKHRVLLVLLVVLRHNLTIRLLELHLVGRVKVLIHELAICAAKAHCSMIIAIHARISINL